MPGLIEMDPKIKNIGGELYWIDLIAVADGKADNATRALAVVALGLVRNPVLEKPIQRWLADLSPAVRGSAAVLLADFPDMATHNRLNALAGDPDSQVRASAALSIGLGQHATEADVLSRLLGDPDATVRDAAAVSLLSFSPTNNAIASIFKANLSNREFAPLFLNALAREDPKNYLDGLANAVERQIQPTTSWGGPNPILVAWEILFKYLQAQPVENVTAGKLDRYLDAMEKVGNYSSSEQVDIYAFYVLRGRCQRAKIFRQKADKVAGYDLDYYFKQVDKNPSLYTRESQTFAPGVPSGCSQPRA